MHQLEASVPGRAEPGRAILLYYFVRKQTGLGTALKGHRIL